MNCRVFPLSDYCFLRVQGPDAHKFLQGQITADLRAVDDGVAPLAAHCTHQGRAVSSFRIARCAEDGYALRVHADLAERALAQLKKYIVFSKAKATLDEHLTGVALAGPDAAVWLAAKGFDVLPDTLNTVTQNNGTVCIHTPGAFELWLPANEACALLTQARVENRLATATAWTLHLIEQGLAEVRAETSELFIPQFLNFQHLGGISFSKGCYTGQEIIARMKYRGKVKRHTYRAQTESGVAIPGTAVFAEGNTQTVGEVVFSAPDAAHLALLVSLTQAAKTAGPVRLGSADGPMLNFLPLPYDPETED